MCQLDIAVRILKQIRTHSVKYARLTKSHGRCMLSGLDAESCSLYADQLHILFLYKLRKHTDGVGTASHTGHYHVRVTSLNLHMLALCLLADDALEFLDHLRIRIRSHRGTDYIEGILSGLGPGPNCLVGGIL